MFLEVLFLWIIYLNGFKLLTDPELFMFQNKQEKETARGGGGEAANYKKLITRLKQMASRALKLNGLLKMPWLTKLLVAKLIFTKRLVNYQGLEQVLLRANTSTWGHTTA